MRDALDLAYLLVVRRRNAQRWADDVPTLRVLNGVLEGFLGTYTSRYSGFEGYWLFGFLIDNPIRVEFDLLTHPAADSVTPVAVARILAVAKFHEQLAKSSLPPARLSSALLTLERGKPSTELAGDYVRPGHLLYFRCEAVGDSARKFERSRSVFVAPHDPRFERRNAKA